MVKLRVDTTLDKFKCNFIYNMTQLHITCVHKPVLYYSLLVYMQRVCKEEKSKEALFCPYTGGFHLHLLDFSSAYQFYFRMTSLDKSTH